MYEVKWPVTPYTHNRFSQFTLPSVNASTGRLLSLQVYCATANQSTCQLLKLHHYSRSTHPSQSSHTSIHTSIHTYIHPSTHTYMRTYICTAGAYHVQIDALMVPRLVGEHLLTQSMHGDGEGPPTHACSTLMLIQMSQVRHSIR